MANSDLLAAAFEAHREHLRAVAYRLLGSMSDADDAVQDTWLRLTGADTSEVENLGGWLTTVVARVSLNMLRARRQPGARLWRAWPGHGPHILTMTSSYTVTWTAFLTDNARFLPLTSRLPTAGALLLPSAIAAPLAVWSLRRHRRPGPAAQPGQPTSGSGLGRWTPTNTSQLSDVTQRTE